MTISLYPDQQDLIEATAASMRAGNRAVLMQAATGAGKSVMASELVRRAGLKESKTWFIVPRRDLLRQMSATYDDFGLDHSFIADKYTHNALSNTHICSLGTLRSRLSKITRPPQLAIVDETHVGGDGLDDIIKWLKAAGCYIIGLSATPWKLSGQGLGCWYDDMVQGLPIADLIRLGRLSSYKAYAPSHPDLSSVGKSAGDYAKGQLSSFMEADRVLTGNAVAHYKKYAHGKLSVAYCVSIKHSQMVAESFRDAGVPAAHMDGETPPEERIRIIRAFANRELLVLTNCELLTYGFDLASQVGRDVTIECMSDLRPTKSLALQMQKWGRVLRRKTEPALIFDHANNLTEHGLPCDDRKWTLTDRKRNTREVGEINVPVRQCDSCYFCHKPAPVCPQCGFVYPVIGREIEEVDGELSEVDVARAKQAARVEVGRAKTIAELQAIAAARGYKPAWVFQMARVKNIRA
ncbi:MAG: DEAD/DEAH box helicase family protein [Leptolyngbyaceae bacterium]|nr:DEAD/DEAH box helicase family protein [Leptolyngbyaceae bacterium]